MKRFGALPVLLMWGGRAVTEQLWNLIRSGWLSAPTCLTLWSNIPPSYKSYFRLIYLLVLYLLESARYSLRLASLLYPG
ncbi:hypothetical protein GGS20DRAFT_536940 [Poronia punctata]|nr:hypothetical protein GGS20DRAFT_536940 [Poronia punctata]